MTKITNELAWDNIGNFVAIYRIDEHNNITQRIPIRKEYFRLLADSILREIGYLGVIQNPNPDLDVVSLNKQYNAEIEKWKEYNTQLQNKVFHLTSELENVTKVMKEKALPETAIEKVNNELIKNLNDSVKIHEEEEKPKPTFKIIDNRRIFQDSKDPEEYTWEKFNSEYNGICKKYMRNEWNNNPTLKEALVPNSSNTHFEEYAKSITEICENFLKANGAFNIKDIATEEDLEVISDSSWGEFNKLYQFYNKRLSDNQIDQNVFCQEIERNILEYLSFNNTLTVE